MSINPDHVYALCTSVSYKKGKAGELIFLQPSISVATIFQCDDSVSLFLNLLRDKKRTIRDLCNELDVVDKESKEKFFVMVRLLEQNHIIENRTWLEDEMNKHFNSYLASRYESSIDFFSSYE